MAQTVVAVYDHHSQAVEGVHQLREEGFQPDQISIFAPDPREIEGFADELGIRVVQAGTAGAVAGGLIGGVGGWLVGAATLAIPGLGHVLAAGAILGAIAGLLGGGTVGGFIGMLVGLGLPHHAAEEYERELQQGRTLVLVHPGEAFARAEAALCRANPMGVHHYDDKIGHSEMAHDEALAAVQSLAARPESSGPGGTVS